MRKNIIKSKTIKLNPLFLILLMPVVLLHAQLVRTSDPELNKIDVIEHLGARIPLDVQLTDSKGERHKLGDYYDGHKPMLLVLAYYHCPMLCNLVLDGVKSALPG